MHFHREDPESQLQWSSWCTAETSPWLHQFTVFHIRLYSVPSHDLILAKPDVQQALTKKKQVCSEICAEQEGAGAEPGLTTRVHMSFSTQWASRPLDGSSADWKMKQK